MAGVLYKKASLPEYGAGSTFSCPHGPVCLLCRIVSLYNACKVFSKVEDIVRMEYLESRPRTLKQGKEQICCCLSQNIHLSLHVL
jgi:hypothetical protein